MATQSAEPAAESEPPASAKLPVTRQVMLLNVGNECKLLGARWDLLGDTIGPGNTNVQPTFTFFTPWGSQQQKGTFSAVTNETLCRRDIEIEFDTRVTHISYKNDPQGPVVVWHGKQKILELRAETDVRLGLAPCEMVDRDGIGWNLIA
ncbi:hypothetical protein R3P38DRAFT_2800515 [Favolaschia claudopus]|uniref:Uncharacterized protein n=1 Tax=Favolaschia claudopus TaxID=2862362 RepID=A0AAV9ZY68_9AGAR